MEVHPETFLVERIVLKDVLANTTVLSFKKVKVNSALNDNLFKFVAPPGTEVIKGLPGTKRP
jgi:outer membrane lipoprotein-sorting protein